MKKIVLLLTLLILVPCLAQGIGGGMEGDSGSVPKVIYTKPADGSVLDLTGKDKDSVRVADGADTKREQRDL